jgi:hypothetical protein
LHGALQENMFETSPYTILMDRVRRYVRIVGARIIADYLEREWQILPRVAQRGVLEVLEQNEEKAG